MEKTGEKEMLTLCKGIKLHFSKNAKQHSNKTELIGFIIWKLYHWILSQKIIYIFYIYHFDFKSTWQMHCGDCIDIQKHHILQMDGVLMY